MLEEDTKNVIKKLSFHLRVFCPMPPERSCGRGGLFLALQSVSPGYTSCQNNIYPKCVFSNNPSTTKKVNV